MTRGPEGPLTEKQRRSLQWFIVAAGFVVFLGLVYWGSTGQDGGLIFSTTFLALGIKNALRLRKDQQQKAE